MWFIWLRGCKRYCQIRASFRILPVAKMFDYEDYSWIANSVIAEKVDVEITFNLLPSFHPDPDSLDETDGIPLPASTTLSTESLKLSSKEALGNERKLAEHYRAVLRLAQEHGQSYNDYNHHMWLQLKFSSNEIAVGFPWYDTLDSMESLFNWLDSAADSETWSDVEQGWEMIAMRIGSRFHYREGAFDQGGEYTNVAFPRERLLLSISDLRKRMSLIISRLTAELGEDYWTRHRYDLRTDLA